MIFALALIQIFGTAMAQLLGARSGAILTGFFGGLVSSTATTAALARRSKIHGADGSSEMLVFLSATSAMLCEGAALVATGTKDIHFSILFIFVGPLIASIVMLYLQSRQLIDRKTQAEDIQFKILPILKLTIFIIVILVLSKLLQNVFGQYGLLILTFLVSLFEIHGSIIANVQLHESGDIGVELLGRLVLISILAAYTSKLFLIATLGSHKLRSQALKATSILFIALFASWLIALTL